MYKIFLDLLNIQCYTTRIMARKLWTIEEDEFLKENYYNLGAKECSMILDRTETSIAHRAMKHGIKSSKTNRSRVWSEEEKTLLINNYSLYGLEYCTNLLPDRTATSIYKTASLLKLKNYNIKDSTPKWTHIEYEQALLSREVEAYPLELYIDSRTPISHSCIEGHEWKARPSNILSGSGCPTCSKSGFDINKPAILYYIKIVDSNDTFYKVGITNRTVAERFELDKDKSITVLLEKSFSRGIHARNEEQLILSKFTNERIHMPGLLKSKGNTELFKQDILKLDRD